MLFYIFNLFKIINFFLYSFFLFFSYNCFAKNIYKIDNIILNIKDNNINSYYYKNLLKKEFGNFINKKEIRNIKFFLYNLNHFNNIKFFYMKNNKNILFLLNYKIIINNLFFIGNKIFKNNEILYYLNKFNISNGKFLNNYNLLKFKIYLINKYKKLGKYNININFLKINFYRNRFLLKIIIKEGNYLKINKISILGSNNSNKNKIFCLMKTKEYNFIFNFFLRKYFNYNKFIQDLNNIKYYYLNNGYFDFYIKKIKIKFYKKDIINIFIEIKEGKRYKIGNILFKSNILNYNKILYLIKNKKFINNTYYKYNNIKKIINNINMFFKLKGYANLNFNIKYKKYKYKIIFLININFNKKFYINKIFFKGIKEIKINFLKKKIPLVKNQLYNISLLKKGILNLKNTGFFKFIKYKEKFININKSNKINIIYKIFEKNNNLFNLNLSYGNKNIVNYNLKLFKKNFLFNNNDLLIKFLKNKLNKSINIFFIYPFNKNNIYIKHEFLFNNNNNNNFNNYDYLNSKYIIKNSIIFILNKNIKYNLSLKYNNIFLYNIKSQLLYIKYFNSINKKYNLNYLNNNFYSNNLFLINNFFLNKLDNNNFFPNFGYYINLYIKYNLLSLYNNNYFKINFLFSNYFSFNKYKKWIFSINNNIGYINSLNNKNIPFYEYFYFGKNNNFIRNFNYENIGINKIFINSKNYICKNKRNICLLNNSSGGNFIISNNLDIIIPNDYFFDKYYSKYLRISFFLDNGIILNNNLNNIFKNIIINKNNYIYNILNINYYKNILKSSIGTSFKIITPIGLIKLSIGFPINYTNNNEINYFQFNIENLFN